MGIRPGFLLTDRPEPSTARPQVCQWHRGPHIAVRLSLSSRHLGVTIAAAAIKMALDRSSMTPGIFANNKRIDSLRPRVLQITDQPVRLEV
jgi:hypothetical protein